MNRMMLGQDDPALQSTSRSTTCLEWSAGRSERPAHCLFGPLHYEPNYAYPLIVWIHGPDDDERQLNRVMPHISLRNYVGVCPRGTSLTQTFADGQRGYTWRQTADEIVLALDRVLDCVELAKARFNINENRVFLAGYDAGGTMALRVALSSPRSVAGAASLGGPLPQNHSPLRNVDRFRDVPLLIAFGRDSATYADERVCDDLRLMHAAGLHSLDIRQYPCGDELVTQMLKDSDAWVMKLVTGVEMDSSSHSQSGYDELN